MLSVTEIRKINLEKMLEYTDRHSFAEKIGVEYNNLNQYLAKKNPKNIGKTLVKRITTSFNLPDAWLDHEHDTDVIRNIVRSSFERKTELVAQDANNVVNKETHPSNSLLHKDNILLITKILRIFKGEDLEVTNALKQTKAVYGPDFVENPVAYQISGTGYAKPYRDGHILICEDSGEPVPGEDALIFTHDNKVYAGEFLFSTNTMNEIISIDGSRDSILKDNISKISPIAAMLPPSRMINL